MLTNDSMTLTWEITCRFAFKEYAYGNVVGTLRLRLLSLLDV